MGATASVGGIKPNAQQLIALREAMDACAGKEGEEWIETMMKASEALSISGDDTGVAIKGEGEGEGEGKGEGEDLEVRKQRNMEFLYACGAYRPRVGVKANLTEANNLWNKGVDTTHTDDDMWTALHHAAGEGELKIVEFLILEAAATIDPVDEFGCTPLWVASCNDRRDVVKFLLMSGASTDIAGKPENEPEQKPALAARRNRHPGLGDLIDAETELRAGDESRLPKQLAHEMTMQEFNDSMRGTLKQVAAM